MPIGKNSIKRITGNGYSNVQTTAPDMENSTVAEAPVTEEAAPKKTKATGAKRSASAKTSERGARKAEKTPVEPTKNAPATVEEPVAPVKRGRGRPRKNPIQAPPTSTSKVKGQSAAIKKAMTPKIESPKIDPQKAKKAKAPRAPRKTAASEKDGFTYVNLGDDLPVHLL